ncbi:hypothetical protein BD289DRAFT_486515 [Coniella lustricola]|uniref:Uncharacterized protein n=1 Tax=Coniella lustricola TaxID=2025994 RepID=A0A2T2ZUV1_9PEZI|nr:hypothetical protein BD289DRAFT_486515 [Coniella lustricola]
MQAVPSLVGTGTVVAAASTGLVFGQPLETNLAQSPRPSRPSSPLSKKWVSDMTFEDSRGTPTPPLMSRPGTSPARPSQDRPGPSPLYSHPASDYQQIVASSRQLGPLKLSGRRQSYVRSVDVTAANASETIREASPSTGSWIRRLSLRPSSQQQPPESPRSSVGPDSTTSFSQTSGASAIKSPTNSLAPTTSISSKLTKRFGASNESSSSIFARRQSKSDVASLRRPATSHQRSATVQQSQRTPNVDAASTVSSMERPLRPRASTTGQAFTPLRLQQPANWTSFFHMRRVKTIKRANRMAPSIDSSSSSISTDYPLPRMRIRLRRGSFHQPFLMKPQTITDANFESATVESEFDRSFTTEASAPSEQSPRTSSQLLSEPSESTSSRRARRSLSTHFKPAAGWRAKASSLRRPKRPSEDYTESRRYTPDPTLSGTPSLAPSGENSRLGLGQIFTPPTSAPRPQKADADLYRLGSSSPPPSAGLLTYSPTQLSPTTAPLGSPGPTHSRAVSKEGASTLAGSDMSVPGLASGDDDTDYKSDALFDSFRTTDTNRLRMAETPLDTMFDESFSAVPGITKTKRLSIQEILGNSWDGTTRILEEDEGSSTPMHGMRGPRIADENGDVDIRAADVARYQFSMHDRNPPRLSLDTIDDEYDWAKDDDEVLCNPLSPPTSSLNSRRGPSPQLRTALSRISGSNSDAYTTVSPTERPTSTLFDWSEPSHEFNDDGFSRPRTSHGKQETDQRGGRSSNRKQLLPIHIRSQSVPVVQQDPQESAKTIAKFGTWAMSNKNVSEDWDDDFDFGEPSFSGSTSSRHAKPLAMRVPPSIQATQPTVKAHSGQIRELSLLVNNLKRLCWRGRQLDLLGGQAASLWQQAETIILLASPDEEELDLSDTDRSFSDFDPTMIEERFLDEGFDASILDRSEESSNGREPEISKHAVVKERQVTRRRSVFSPDDEIFGNSFLEPPITRPHTPRTPERVREFHTPDGTVVSSVIAAMEHQRSMYARVPESPLKPSNAKLFFDTNSLQELVKRASNLFHALSDIVRREELLTMSPQATPRNDRTRRGETPAFTRVFSGPEEGSPRHLVKSQKSHSPMPRTSMDSNSLRMQMMTVN